MWLLENLFAHIHIALTLSFHNLIFRFYISYPWWLVLYTFMLMLNGIRFYFHRKNFNLSINLYLHHHFHMHMAGSNIQSIENLAYLRCWYKLKFRIIGLDELNVISFDFAYSTSIYLAISTHLSYHRIIMIKDTTCWAPKWQLKAFSLILVLMILVSDAVGIKNLLGSNVYLSKFLDKKWSFRAKLTPNTTDLVNWSQKSSHELVKKVAKFIRATYESWFIFYR